MSDPTPETTMSTAPTGPRDITEAMVEAGAEALGWNPLIWSAAKTHARAVIKAALVATSEPDGLAERVDYLWKVGQEDGYAIGHAWMAIEDIKKSITAHDAALAEMRTEFQVELRGEVARLERILPAVTEDAETCYRCHGKGRSMLGDTCPRCHGQGVEPEAAPKTALDALYRDAQSWARHFAPCVEDDNNWYRGESSIDGKDAAEIGELFAETVRLIPLLKAAIANTTEDE